LAPVFAPRVFPSCRQVALDRSWLGLRRLQERRLFGFLFDQFLAVLGVLGIDLCIDITLMYRGADRDLPRPTSAATTNATSAANVRDLLRAWNCALRRRALWRVRSANNVGRISVADTARDSIAHPRWDHRGTAFTHLVHLVPELGRGSLALFPSWLGFWLCRLQRLNPALEIGVLV